MDNRLDLDAMFAKGDRLVEGIHPGFVHAERRPGARAEWTELTFPGGLICTTNSVPAETEVIYNSIFVHREYLPPRIEVADGDTMVDVGANVGMFALFVLSCYEHAKLHCIEPVPANFEVLRRNLERYRDHDVHLHNVALGGEPHGRADIIHYPHFTGNSTIHPEQGRVQFEAFSSIFTREEMDYLYEKEVISVPTISLSTFMRREGIDVIDLLKLDTEGSEIDIFRGIDDEDWSRVRQITMEVHDVGNLLAPVIEILASKGMKTVVDEATRDHFGDILLTATHG